MDAILFSAREPEMVVVDDAIRHLDNHKELWWEVGFRIFRDKFKYPMIGFIHMKGGQVEYKVEIEKIIPFSRNHYEDENANDFKPEIWINEWKNNKDDCQNYKWRNSLVITKIEPFSYDTYKFIKYDGQSVKKPPQSYIRVLPPGTLPFGTTPPIPRRPVPERLLEDFIIERLEEIEAGLRLEERQLNTEAGRLDLLCRDRAGQFVVVEVKRSHGTDQVVGQILRYMGWVQENYRTDNVRGIIIVGKKDQALSYAIKAATNIQTKEYKISIG